MGLVGAMELKLTIIVQSSEGEGRALTVGDAMGQILDWVALIESNRNERKPAEKVRWLLESASINSPFEVGIIPEGPPEATAVWMNEAAEDISFASNVMRVMADGDVPECMSFASIKAAKRILNRNLNGVSVTSVESSVGDDFFLDVAKSRKALSALEKFSTSVITIGKHRARGDIVGRLVRAGEFYGKEAFWVQDKRDREVACVMTPSLAEKVGGTMRLADVWKNTKMLIYGIKHYGDDGKLVRMDVTREPELVESKPVNLDRVIDPDFTGDYQTEDHLARLRGEHA